MEDIGWRGIALGVAFGVLGKALYDTFFYLISGQLLEEWKASFAGLLTTGTLLLIFYRLGYLKARKKTE